MQVRKLDKIKYDLRKASGDDISMEEYARQHGQVPLQAHTRRDKTYITCTCSPLYKVLLLLFASSFIDLPYPSQGILVVVLSCCVVDLKETCQHDNFHMHGKDRTGPCVWGARRTNN